MKVMKTLLKGVGKGVLAAVVVLMCASLSFAATTIYVNQDATGMLTVTTLDCNGNVTNPPNVIPNSCSTPDLFWDADAGELRLNGFDASNPPAPKWTGTIDATGNFTTTMSSLPSVTCGSVTPNVVSATFSTAPTVVTSQACTNWNYDPTWNPSPCAAGSIQTRKATGVPSGCIGGFPDITQMVRSCPPQTCTSWDTVCNGTCSSTTNTCPAAVTSSYPAGCVGGTPPSTRACTPGVACTDYTYSSWGTCTNGSQTRTQTGYTPAGCTGTPAASPVLTQGCSSSGDPSGTKVMTAMFGENSVALASHAVQYFKFTTPAGGCSAYPMKWLQVNLITVSLAGGDGQLLVKKSNKGASSWPTLDDYTYEFTAHKYTGGQDWTRDSKGGVFFWNFANGGAGEKITVTNSYYGHTFSQDDTYYVLLYNAGSASNSYRVTWGCY